MFRFEKDMIPVLKQGLSEKYKTKYFIEEFSSGIGIADLVFALDVNKRCTTMNDYESIFYIEKYFNKINKQINIEKLINDYSLKKNKIYSVIEYMKSLNLIDDSNEDHFLMNNYYTPAINELFSIEAKIKDWKSGFHQALRYKNYSHKSFLAISEEFIHRVDINLLKEFNVGLISVNDSSINIIHNPPKIKPRNKTAFYYNAEKFYSYYMDEFLVNC